MRRTCVHLVAVAALLSAAACGGGDGEPSGLDTATPAPTVTAPPTEEPTPTPSPEPTNDLTVEPTSAAELATDQRILDDYRQARDAYRAAYNPANPEHPGLLAWYDGDALAGTQDELRGLIAEGHSEVIEYEYHPEVLINEQGQAAIVEDCFSGHVQTVDTATGDTIGEPNIYTRLVNYNLTMTGDRWMIVSGQTLEDSCTPEE